MAHRKNVRKKKHVNVAEQQKQREAQYKKLFMDKLRGLCRQIKDENLYNQIPAKEKLLLYIFRGAPLKIVAAEGAKTKEGMMEALEKIIRMQQRTMTLKLVKDSEETMNFADYLLVGMALEYHACDSEVNYPGKEQFAQFAELSDEREEMYEKGIDKICTCACWVFDDIGSKYLHTYKLEISMKCTNYGPPPENAAALSQREIGKIISRDYRVLQKITIGTYFLETRKVSVDGETHSAIQAGRLLYSSSGPKFHQFTLSPDDMHLNIHSPFSSLGLPVYIQQHALNRMSERLGFIIPAFQTTVLVEAFMRKEIIPVAKNRILIAGFINEMKVGYFIAELVDGIILIRTFLLLTNSGTPEGDRLSKLTGLQIDDRKYLAIDTLPGLANSDIAKNEAICKLFYTAGCGSILELCEKINNDPGVMWMLNQSQPKNIIADLITEYLKPNTDNE
jgi:uncharacterized membrane protein